MPAMPAEPQIQIDQTDASVALSWDNRRVEKERFLVPVMLLLWVLWTAVTVFVTGLAWDTRGAQLVLWVIWLFGGWLGVLLVPYTLLTRRWRESIVLDRQNLTVTKSGLMAPRPRAIPIGSIEQIVIGYRRAGGTDADGIFSLDVFPRGALNPVALGSWLAPELKRQVFDALEVFVQRQMLPIEMRRNP